MSDLQKSNCKDANKYNECKLAADWKKSAIDHIKEIV